MNYRTLHTTNFMGDGKPSCSPCRKRFTTIFANLVADNQWLAYAIVAYLKYYFQTYFRAEKCGRWFGGSAWGSLVDKNGRWGFAFEIINLTKYVSKTKMRLKILASSKSHQNHIH